jgi:hypothetical protein
MQPTLAFVVRFFYQQLVPVIMLNDHKYDDGEPTDNTNFVKKIQLSCAHWSLQLLMIFPFIFACEAEEGEASLAQRF